MVCRQRLAVIDVQRRKQAARLNGGDERILIHQGGARGVDQYCAWSHPRKLVGAEHAAGSLGNDEVKADDVGACEQFVHGNPRCACGKRALVGEVLAPGKDPHAERVAITRHLRTDPAEADQTDRFPGEDEPGFRPQLESARPDCLVGLRDAPGRGQHQRQRQLRGALHRRSAAGVADDDAALDHGGDVDQRRARSGEPEHLEPGKAGDERAGEGRSFAGAEHDVEIGQRLCGGFAGKRLAKELDLGARDERRPIGARPGRSLPIVEHGDARHCAAPSDAGSFSMRNSRTRRIAAPRRARPFHGARTSTLGACARSADTSAG